tara:strand:+ start:914 stop:1096 length:183 start_codon:yes stop_codon:yes gene_type:complete
MLDFALCIASGLPFNDLQVIQGTVLYVTGEGRIGINQRIDAWCMKNSQSADMSEFINACA